MSVDITTSTVLYTGNGSNKIFTVPYRFLEDAHLVVSVKNQGAGAYTVKTLGVDYSVSGAGQVAGNGKVTFVAAPANNASVKILRSVPLTQLTDLRSQGDFLPGTHEDALDKLTMIAQQLNDGTIVANNITGGGEVNTGTNLGAGSYVYKDKSGVSLRFRSIVAADPGVTVTTSGDEILVGSLFYTYPWRGSFTAGGNTWTTTDAGITDPWLASATRTAVGKCKLQFDASPGITGRYFVSVTPTRDTDKGVSAAILKNANYVEVWLYKESNNSMALSDDVSFDIVVWPDTDNY